ncbi:MAG TPA: flagellar basal-body MS-ring/collar protein FliF [Verrucomicrobiota bacterium]|nr:flagellar basal-body MS-ring/collar protein FliF [Verrucomicrobiota bacterium]
MMKNLNQLGHQLLEIWKQLGLNQRISVVLAAVVVVGGLLGVGFWSSRTEYALLYGKLDEAEAAKVISAIDEMKVPYRLSESGGRILVPRDKKHYVRMHLAEKGIPRGEGVGFEIFDKPNFGLSDFIQRANFQRALQGELARTISQLDDVEGAWVQIVMPENRLLVDRQKRPTASVFIRVRGNSPLAPAAINSIRFLVANAVEGLQAHNVTVVDNHGNVETETAEPDSLAGISASQLVIRRNLEHYFARKAEDLLTKVLGPGQAVVRVAAEINFDTINRTEKKYDPDGQVARTETVNDETTDTLSGSSGGVVGVTANATTETNLASTAPVNNSRMRKKTMNKEYDINESTSTILQSGGGIKRLSAAVFVATRMEGTGPDRKPLPRTQEELQKLRNIVQNALGIVVEGDGSRKDEIALEEMPFNDQLAVDLTRQVETQQQREFWLNLGKNLLYPALALGVLLVFWRSFRRTPAENIPIGIPLGPLAGKNGGNGHSNGNGNGHGNGHGNGKSRVPWQEESEPAVVTVEVLNQLVRENPNNMTEAIRSWMAKGNANGG